MVEGIDEDKITAEIEDLQHKLGDLQSNIDKVLQEVDNFQIALAEPAKSQIFPSSQGRARRRRKRSTGQSDVQKMSEELEEILQTVGN